MEEKILKEIQKLIKDKFGKTVKIDSKLSEIGVDSLDLLDLVVEAEEKHSVRIEDSELLNMETVKDIVTAISSKIK